MGKDDGVPHMQKAEAMFEKLLLDSKAFFRAAERAWEDAGQLNDEAKRADESEPANVFHLSRATGDNPAVRIESALTAAAMNLTISIELLLKGFIGVDRRFDEGALAAMKQVGHGLDSAIDGVPREWADELERLFEAAGGASVDVAVLYHPWNPPKGKWIGDTDRLGGNSLRDFLRILNQERLETDRYSFQRFAEDNFRVKILNGSKLDEFHSKACELLLEKAVACGLAEADGLVVEVVLGEDGEREGRSGRVTRVEMPPKLNFELDQMGAELLRRQKD